MTGMAVILGTASYMSPEQARGGPVDKRTDVWAFGDVLYEMLTGRPAFPGETTSDTIAAVLGREPGWQALPAATPVKIRDLTRKESHIEKTKRRPCNALTGSGTMNRTLKTATGGAAWSTAGQKRP
jgi:serine/threonine protein kinase